MTNDTGITRVETVVTTRMYHFNQCRGKASKVVDVDTAEFPQHEAGMTKLAERTMHAWRLSALDAALQAAEYEEGCE